MLLNHLKIAWRNLLKNKVPTAINIIGLAIGIAGCLVVFQIANHELNVNKDVLEGDRIYRVYSRFNGQFSGDNSGVPTGVFSMAADNLTGAEVQCMFHCFRAKVEVPGPNGVGKRNLGSNKDLVIVEPTYFDLIQNYTWIEGSPHQSLSEPFQVVLTDGKVKQYFGLADPRDAIGREVVYADSLVTIVSGIIKNPDFSSDFTFNDFISRASIQSSFLKSEFPLDTWNSVRSADQLFVKAAVGVTAEELQVQLQPIVDRFNKDKEEGEAPNEFKLQPLSDLHFNQSLSTFDYGPSPAHMPTLYGLMGIAGLLLLIAGVNFVNLATVQATGRSKETGVRKVIGATRGELSSQYLTETALLTIMTLPVALGLSEMAHLYFAEYLPEGMQTSVLSPAVFLFLVAAVVVVTFLAGLYPAFLMSSFNPAFAIKNQTSLKGSSGLRKGLIAFQFVLAQAFIIGALVMGQQLHFVLNKDLGFDKEAVVYFYLPFRSEVSKRQLLQQELAKQPNVVATTLQNKPPMEQGYQTNVITYEQNGEKVKAEVHFRTVDTSYVNVFGLEFLAGRNFMPSDTIREFIINERLATDLGYATPADAIGNTIEYISNEIPIVGVVADFHVRSFHHAIPPMAITTHAGRAYSIAAKLNASQPIAATMDQCKAVWGDVFPGTDFNYYFIDENVEKMYQTETKTAKLINTAMGLAILISCLGLFGLALFTINARAKEISIRKILGASVASVVGLLSKEVVVLVVLSLIVAAPVAFYFMNNWLSNFSYHIEIGWWVFVLAGLASVGVAFLTVSFQSIKAALANPVDSLRSE